MQVRDGPDGYAAGRFFFGRGETGLIGGYRVVDRQNPLFVRSYSGELTAAEDCAKLNANPPAKRSLFPVSASSCRISRNFKGSFGTICLFL